MSIKIDFSGLDNLIDNLNKQVNSLNGEVGFDKLFTNNFMSKYTRFRTFDELVDKSGYKVSSAEDFEAIPSNEWNCFILNNTIFNSWDDMKTKAGEEYVANNLHF